ncbi:MAG: VWA domain-containing protein [Elusimicrobia bacterium]|nr:VWA domain-containing protein [Elusimicrobiota bacterium]
MKTQTRLTKFNLAWSLVLASVLAATQTQAQQLIAWPMGQGKLLNTIMPGMPIRPLPLPHPLPFPRPGPNPRPPVVTPPVTTPVSLSGYSVEGTVDDQAANLSYRITFHNPTGSRLEGVLIVPIPADTVLSGFSMTVGGKSMKGELLESGQATTIYENIVRQLRDPALLELIGERMFRARVFPIEPNSDVEVRLSMTQVLHKSGDLTSLTVPLKSAQMIQGASGRGSIKLDLNTSKPIRTLYSPNPAVAITKDGDNKARITYEPASAATAEDLSLFYSMREDPLAAGLLTFKEQGEDGYFMLSLSPKPHVDEKIVTPKDVVFIVDRSGSMEENGKIEQARKALAYCLKRLSAHDRFGIVDFATDTSAFEDHLVAGTTDNKARALRYVERIEAAGGTNIEGGLNEGLKLLHHEEGRVPMVFFMTDGLPTVGQTDISSLLTNAEQTNQALRARLFTFGVGSDVNTLFLDKLAETNRGTHDYVATGEDIENKISTLYQKVAKPALTDVKLDWKGVDAVQVYPRPVTDLFYGAELTLMGRYKGHGKGNLVVTGRSGGREARFEFPVELPDNAPRHSFLPRLWANMKVAHELDAIRLSGRADPEVVNEIVRLAKRFGIVTPYTSYLITEEGMNLQNAHNQQVRILNDMSQTAKASGFTGGARLAMKAQAASSLFQRMAEVAAPSSLSMVSGAASNMDVAASRGGGGGFDAMKKAENEVRQELKDEGRSVAETKSVAGKTFYRRGSSWIDGDYELAENKSGLGMVKINYLSPEYFDLLHAHPELGRYLAVGSDLTVVFEGKAYQIVPGAP